MNDLLRTELARVARVLDGDDVEFVLERPRDETHGDLATNLGHRGQVDHPDVQAAVGMIEAALLRSEVVPGGVARTPEQANAMLERGYKALMLGFDWSLLQRGAASILDGIWR